jgi:hypothetical protein
MNVREEIRQHAKEEERPILDWLFDRYHMESQWNFVARCTWQRYGTHSYQSNRVWTPTPEGRALYEYANFF